MKRLLGPAATRVVVEPTGSWRLQRPLIDPALCVRCGICVEYCPTGSLALLPPEDPVLALALFTCKGCGICATLCPRAALAMAPEEGSHA